uniref:Synaptobrevin, longin-like domain protein n=1 Tax=Tanacetum cinerariifolium TaxID=118510 RepID=A0A6L2JBI3_TANCI|nr:hypothetical protein [Tanacetum cinerariifolium]
MTLTFAKTHNIVAYLSKSDASEGFNQIIDFLNGSSIKYALTVNLNIYVSCIKQFWTTVTVKKVNDIIRLQALVDKKKVGVEYLPNEEIFAELSRMGYEKPSTKLTFYKAFFSSQWKFLIHTILQCMSAKRTSWNEFSSLMASAIICLSSGDLSTHTTKYTSPALTQKVFANMRRAGKGFSGVDTPLFEGMLVAQEVEEGDADEKYENVNASDTAEGDVSAAHGEDAGIPMNLLQEVMDTCTALTRRVEHLELDKVAQAMKITNETITAASITITAAEAQVLATTLTDAPERVTTAPKEPKPLKKQQQIEQDEKYARELEAELNMNIDWDKVIEHVKKKAKEDPATKEQIKEEESRALKRLNETPAKKAAKRKKLDEEMDHFKGMSYDDIRPIFEAKFNTNVAFLLKIKEQIEEEESRALKRLNETPAKKAAKRKKLDEENNKPYYKIIRADDTHQLYVSFLSLLRNFDIDDLEALWSLVKKRFSTTKPKNFSDDFLLITLGAMFEKPDIHAQIWKNQRMERKYPLKRFTLDQMLNAVRLEVEEESEVFLELLSFGVDAAKEFKKNMLSV